MDSLPDRTVSIGPWMYAGLDVSELRVIPVFRGSPLLIDPVTLTQNIYDRQAWVAVRKIFGACKADIWLWPHGWPAATGMPYSGDNTFLFLDAMTREFREHYSLLATGPVFDQWQCAQRGQPAPS